MSINVGGLPIVLAFGGVESQYWASAGCATKAPDKETARSKAGCLNAIMSLIGSKRRPGFLLGRTTKRWLDEYTIRLRSGKSDDLHKALRDAQPSVAIG